MKVWCQIMSPEGFEAKPGDAISEEIFHSPWAHLHSANLLRQSEAWQLTRQLLMPEYLLK